MRLRLPAASLCLLALDSPLRAKPDNRFAITPAARAATCLGLVVALSTGGCESSGPPTVIIRGADRYLLPGVSRPEHNTANEVDCNNPAHWDGNTLYVFSSVAQPYRTFGPDLFNLHPTSERTAYDNEEGYNGARWIEATYKERDGGLLYAWYHLEPGGVCPGKPLTAPQIGAVVSHDNGLNWWDLGIILTAPDDALDCDTPNGYFAGGNGDFSVILDQNGEYFYFLISTYNRDVAEQGVSIARMRFADRADPAGKVWKWHNGQWSEPGLGGKVTPIFNVAVDWHRQDVDAFWGPSIHWNTYLRQYVMLLNRAINKEWKQEGIYISFNRDLSDPEGWTAPVRILGADMLEASKWYPQVIGTDSGRRETDKLAGRSARLFVTGRSNWEIVFLRPGESEGPRLARAPCCGR
jgi:hypothetical protein